jgi:hypothetical protein
MIIEILPLFKNIIELIQEQYSNSAKAIWINVDNISDIEKIKYIHRDNTFDHIYGQRFSSKEFNYYLLNMSSGTKIPIGEEELNKIFVIQKTKK